MLYNNICIKLPTRPRPTTVSLTPYEAAAPLVPVEVELDPVLVAVPVPLARPVGLAVSPLQTFVPWMALLGTLLQSRVAVLSMLEPPRTTVRPERSTEEKFPVKSMAPSTVVSFENEMESRAELLAIWTAPPTDVRRGMEMLARFGLATKAKLPVLLPVLPTVVKFGALTDLK